MARQGQHDVYDTYATVAGVLQGLQALSPRRWPPLGAFIKLPALRVVHDLAVLDMRTDVDRPALEIATGTRIDRGAGERLRIARQNDFFSGCARCRIDHIDDG